MYAKDFDLHIHLLESATNKINTNLKILGGHFIYTKPTQDRLDWEGMETSIKPGVFPSPLIFFLFLH